MKTFFIAGVQRSGTTLLSVMLSKHPAILLERRSLAFRIISCFNSLNDILPYNYSVDRQKLLQWLVRHDDHGRLAELIHPEDIQKNQSFRQILENGIAKKLARENKQIWGDKSPNVQHFLKDLKLLLPDTKILHIVRDGRATAKSLHSRGYQNLLLSAQQWVDGNNCGLVNQQFIGAHNYKIIRYEDVLVNPEKEMRAVCEFLEIPFSEDLLDLEDSKISKDNRYVKTFFDQSKIDKWKDELSVRQIKKIEAIQGPLLKELGYALETKEDNFVHRPLSLIRRLFYKQWDNFKQIFRRERLAMKNRENVKVKIPLRSRVYTFLRVFVQEIFSPAIFKNFFSRVFYREKYYKGDE